MGIELARSVTTTPVFYRGDPPWSLGHFAVGTSHSTQSNDQATLSACSRTLQVLCAGNSSVEHFLFSSSYEDEPERASAVMSTARTRWAACSNAAVHPQAMLDCLTPFGWMLEENEKGVFLHSQSSGGALSTTNAFGIAVRSGVGPLTVRGLWKTCSGENKTAAPWVLKALAGDLIGSGKLPEVDRILVARGPSLGRISRFTDLGMLLVEYCEQDLKLGETILVASPSQNSDVIFLKLEVFSRPAISRVGAY